MKNERFLGKKGVDRLGRGLFVFAAILGGGYAAISMNARAESTNPVVVSGVDFLQSTQTYGAAKLDRSTSGEPLRIAGKEYESGIGVHAISEFPLSVAVDAVALQGFCGMDDTAEGNANGKALFRILSGSAVLWESGEMKTGDAAQPFSVEIPEGCQKLFLQVDDLGDNSYDHANWVDLSWKTGERESKPARVLKGQDFGLKPNDASDQSAAFNRAVEALRAAPGSTLSLEKGTYHFHYTGALKRHIHVSNHGQPDWQPVSVSLVDLRDVTIEGNGSVFLFHGQVMPMLIQDTSKLKISGIALDYAVTPDAQGTVTKVTSEYYEVSVDQKKYPHRMDGEWLTFTGPGWEKADRSWGIVFDGKTHEIVAGTGDFDYRGEISEIRDGQYRVKKDLKKSGIKAGDTITMRHGSDRPHPGCVLYRAKDTVLENFMIFSSHGMALLAQRSENIHLKGGGVYPRPGSGRNFSGGADATHFSNCKGLIFTENCRYEGMMDDAINVHATCLRVDEKIDARTIRCRFVHGQAYGFEVVLPGESIRFIQAKWLTPRDPRKVVKVEWIDNKNMLLTLDEDIPEDLGEGDAIENADWHASVHFKNNIVRNNRARGSLFTSPKPIVIEGNTFETIAGSAILLAGDANGWYESGACHDVVIRNNTFRNNLTSRFQFTEALISIYPEVPDLQGQTEYYHRNVRIEGNKFETFDVPLLFAISTKGLSFTGNEVNYNKDYPSWGRKPFVFRRCAEVKIGNNTVKNAPYQWTREAALDLHLTPEREVEF